MKELLGQWKLCGLALIFISCDSSVELSDYINTTSPFTLSLPHFDHYTGLTTYGRTEIKVNSDKYKKLISWTKINNEGWTSSPVTWSIKIAVWQDNFHLLYYPDGFVVISFVDKEYQGRQYSKEIKAGELDFLINE